MSKTKTNWWALSLSETCNRSLAEYLGDDALQRDLMTDLGKKSLWQLKNYADVLRYSASVLKCDFFKQEGPDGEIKSWIPEPWMRKKIPYMVKIKAR